MPPPEQFKDAKKRTLELALPPLMLGAAEIHRRLEAEHLLDEDLRPGLRRVQQWVKAVKDTDLGVWKPEKFDIPGYRAVLQIERELWMAGELNRSLYQVEAEEIGRLAQIATDRPAREVWTIARHALVYRFQRGDMRAIHEYLFATVPNRDGTPFLAKGEKQIQRLLEHQPLPAVENLSDEDSDLLRRLVEHRSNEQMKEGDE